MLVRHPKFDLGDTPAIWGDVPEAVAFLNATGIIPAPVERYLIRVMREAKKLLDRERDADLIRDIELFNRQEGQHFAAHAEMMAWMRDGGFTRLPDLEAMYEAELQEFLATKPLEWNLSYCESFESSGLASCYPFIDGRWAEWCGDHGSQAMAMWQWHNAEEFEHRGVVHDVMRRLYGDDRATDLRIEWLDHNRDHLSRHAMGAREYAIDVVRATMTPSERTASIDRENALFTSLADATLENITWAYERDYDPHSKPIPDGWHEVLDAYTPG